MSIFQMSITSTILILVIVMIRALAIHKLPKKTFLILWGVVLLRLLIPFSVPTRFSENTVLNQATEFVSVVTGMQASLATDKKASVATDMQASVVTEMQNSVVTDMQTTFSNAETIADVGIISNLVTSTTPDRVVQTSSVMIVWVVGMIICALFFIVTHLRCRREYNAALTIENAYINEWLLKHKTRRSLQIRQSDRINTPMTYGIWNLVILFPKTTDWKNHAQLRYVLTHELTHIRRFDILTKWLLVAALCVHWFNPFVWAMYILANRDIELACDETVVCAFGDTMKSAYALTLIELEEKKSGFAPLFNNFAKNAIEERIDAIMKIKRITIMGTILAFVMVIGLIIGTLAVSAVSERPEGDVSAQSKGDVSGEYNLDDAKRDPLEDDLEEKHLSETETSTEAITKEKANEIAENEKHLSETETSTEAITKEKAIEIAENEMEKLKEDKWILERFPSYNYEKSVSRSLFYIKYIDSTEYNPYWLLVFKDCREGYQFASIPDGKTPDEIIANARIKSTENNSFADKWELVEIASDKDGNIGVNIPYDYTDFMGFSVDALTGEAMHTLISTRQGDRYIYPSYCSIFGDYILDYSYQFDFHRQVLNF